MVLQSPAYGETVQDPLADSSGNGHDLTEHGDPVEASPAVMTKYGDGFALDGVNDWLGNRDNAWDVLGDAALFVAAEVDAPQDGDEDTLVGLVQQDDSNHKMFLSVQGDGTVRYNDSGGSDVTSTTALTADEYTFVVRRVDNGDGTNDVTIKVFDESGTLVLDMLPSEFAGLNDRPAPDSHASTELTIGSQSKFDGTHGKFFDGLVQEVRVWAGTIPTQATLDDLADPTSTTLEQTAEGNELALYFMETTGTGTIRGEQIPLPVGTATHQGMSLAEVIPLFGDPDEGEEAENIAIELGKLKEAVQLQGILTDAQAQQLEQVIDGATYQSAVAMRDAIRRTRLDWPMEVPEEAKWDNTNLPSEERDSVTDRQRARVRLIFDKHDDGNKGRDKLEWVFLYGIVADFSFDMEAPNAPHRIPYQLTFMPTSRHLAAQPTDWNESSGEKLYLATRTNTIDQFDVSTAYDVSTATAEASHSFAQSEVDIIDGVAWRSDGSRVYAVDIGGVDSPSTAIVQADVSVAWDLASTVSNVARFSTEGQTTLPTEVAFNNDGTKMFVTGRADVFEYALSTPWDVTSASFTTSLAGNLDTIYGLTFKEDGSKLYVCGNNTSGNGAVAEFDLSAAYDLTTASLKQKFFDDTNTTGPFFDVEFNTAGTKMYCPTDDTLVFTYDLSTPGDISTAAFASSTDFGGVRVGLFWGT